MLQLDVFHYPHDTSGRRRSHLCHVSHSIELPLLPRTFLVSSRHYLIYPSPCIANIDSFFPPRTGVFLTSTAPYPLAFHSYRAPSVLWSACSITPPHSTFHLCSPPSSLLSLPPPYPQPHNNNTFFPMGHTPHRGLLHPHSSTS
uniref:Uncharacterized protein n=1 Tax=Knipowitschia caucasica TaxID=637954 RepID=A0AAV2KSN3_KNICA